MAWYMKISLFYYQNTRNFKTLSTNTTRLPLYCCQVYGGIFYANAIIRHAQ